MEIGLCVGFDAVKDVAKLGYDYAELPLAPIAALSEEAFVQLRADIEAAGVAVPCFNVLFPQSIALVESTTGAAEIETYLHGAFARAQALGGQTVVLGSGKSRTRPEGMSYGEAFRRLVERTRLIGEVAARYGITIVIEPLNRTETNTINCMAEGAALAAATNHPNVQLLADFYHVRIDGEPVTDIVRLTGVAHTHVAAKEGRLFPRPGDGEAYDTFFAQLKQSGYTGRMSVEGRAEDFANDAVAALQLLRALDREA